MAISRVTGIDRVGGAPPVGCSGQAMIAAAQHHCNERCEWIAEPVSLSMASRVVQLTPEIALGWLKRNGKNRIFSRGNARSLAEDMASGYWRENGESIVFDDRGILIDGQHRLQACVNSGHQYLVPVITGVMAEVRPTVDTGQKRTSANNLQMAGEKNASALAATVLLWKGYESRVVRQITHPYHKTSISEILEYLGEWPGLREAVRTARTLTPQRQGRAIVPLSEVAMVWFAIVEAGGSKARANEFLGAVLSGFNLGPGNPILALRRRLQEFAGRPGQRMSKRERLALLLRAWQLWSTGQTRQVLRWDADQEFPFLTLCGPITSYADIERVKP